VKRGATLASIFACGAAGVLLAFALGAVGAAGAAGAGTTGTTTTSEPPPTTTPTPTAPPPTTAPLPPPQPRTIVAGVTVGHVLVGGLTRREAIEVLHKTQARPLKLVVSRTRTITVAPQELGAAAHLRAAVDRALRIRTPGLNVPLVVDTPRPKLERYVRRLGRLLDRQPVDSRLILRKLRPLATKAASGRRLNRVLTTRTLVRLLKTHDRTPLRLPFRELQPQVTPDTVGYVIVIRRGENRLYLYDGTKFDRRFQVATGQSIYPTPLGHYEIVTKWRNPWWYPPQGSAWAAGKEPIPPGPGNPLGTRWMGLSAPYVGIHGTPDPASIGYSASHGCIRMRISEAEWLFDHVDVGTQVFIVAA
jgi:lipoprotein-anchoring transpeptidase ErfK/SrfK